MDITTDPSTSITSALPIEVLGHVADILADDLGKKNARALQSLAITCKSFLPFCRARMFRRIDRISFFGDGIRNSGGGRLLRLVKVLEDNPELLMYVQELRICYDTRERGQKGMAVVEDYQRCQAMLLRFSSLEQLTCLHDSDVYGSGLALMSSLRHELAEHYLAQHTLKYFCGQDMSSLNFNTLFNGPRVEVVHLVRSSIPVLHQLPAANITELHIRKVQQFPLSILSAAPKLMVLSLDQVPNVSGDRSDLFSRPPSMTLRALHLDLTAQDGLSTILDYYKYHARKVEMNPFNQLKRLVLYLKRGTDARNVQPLFEDAKELLSLQVIVQGMSERLLFIKILTNSTILDAIVQLHSLKLNKHIFTPSHKLTRLALIFTPIRSQTAYTSILSHLRALFTSIAESNILEQLRISIDSRRLPILGDHRQAAFLTSPWEQIDTVLSSRVYFAHLRRVSISLRLEVTQQEWEALYKGFGGMGLHALQPLSGVMTGLHERLGPDLKETFLLHY
ncbi:hypothetical protein CVT24_007427 [Panaeolus cyanescens]|uniref:F-box domain-containing protein n=1 Tax=Panaeolus cyanescens TaxID=181874 RepID=A0A409YL01_9AGAR|nr:hypothetical protein CVT24_007427 [Panaeolus cyanescens]